MSANALLDTGGVFDVFFEQLAATASAAATRFSKLDKCAYKFLYRTLFWEMSLIAATASATLPGKNIIAHAREQMQRDSTKLAADTIRSK